jgi:periplasmic divalent cation tolerance protein
MVLIYIVTENREEAKRAATMLIEKKLTHSVNILPEVFSMRVEEGKVIEYTETIVLVKTKALLYQRIEEEIKSMNKESPDIIFSVPITQINNNMYQRIIKNTEHV